MITRDGCLSLCVSVLSGRCAQGTLQDCPEAGDDFGCWTRWSGEAREVAGRSADSLYGLAQLQLTGRHRVLQ